MGRIHRATFSLCQRTEEKDFGCSDGPLSKVSDWLSYHWELATDCPNAGPCTSIDGMTEQYTVTVSDRDSIPSTTGPQATKERCSSPATPTLSRPASTFGLYKQILMSLLSKRCLYIKREIVRVVND